LEPVAAEVVPAAESKSPHRVEISLSTTPLVFVEATAARQTSATAALAVVAARSSLTHFPWAILPPTLVCSILLEALLAHHLEMVFREKLVIKVAW